MATSATRALLTGAVVNARNTEIFVAKETSVGTLVYPSASGAVTVTEVTFAQTAGYTDVEAIRSSRTPIDKVFNRMDYGTFSVTLSAMPKQVASAGTSIAAPQNEGLFLEMAMGKVTDTDVDSPDVNAVSASAMTAANPSVITVTAGHGFKVGDVVKLGGISGTDLSAAGLATVNIDGVTNTTLTTDLNMSGKTLSLSSATVDLNCVRYELAKNIGSFSMWMNRESSDGYAVIQHALAGCTIDTMSTSFDKSGELQFTFSGQCSRIFRGGSFTFDADIPASSTTSVSGETNDLNPSDVTFEGMRFDVMNSSNKTMAGEVFVVSSTHATDGTVSVTAVGGGAITPSGAIESDTGIAQPVLPSHSTQADSQVVSKRSGAVFFGAKNSMNTASGAKATANLLPVKTASLDMSQAIETPLLEELNGTDFPDAAFLPGLRSSTGSFQLVVRGDDQKQYEKIRKDDRSSLVFKVGDSTKETYIEFYIPHAQNEVPADSDVDGAPAQDFAFTALEPQLDNMAATGTEKAEAEFRIWYKPHQ